MKTSILTQILNEMSYRQPGDLALTITPSKRPPNGTPFWKVTGTVDVDGERYRVWAATDKATNVSLSQLTAETANEVKVASASLKQQIWAIVEAKVRAYAKANSHKNLATDSSTPDAEFGPYQKPWDKLNEVTGTSLDAAKSYTQQPTTKASDIYFCFAANWNSDSFDPAKSEKRVFRALTAAGFSAPRDFSLFVGPDELAALALGVTIKNRSILGDPDCVKVLKAVEGENTAPEYAKYETSSTDRKLLRGNASGTSELSMKFTYDKSSSSSSVYAGGPRITGTGVVVRNGTKYRVDVHAHGDTGKLVNIYINGDELTAKNAADLGDVKSEVVDQIQDFMQSAQHKKNRHSQR